ncbi:MAG: AMP-binding protein [Desulfobulbaceae bacterium]|jgi:acyl-[acyl-carrier-protein]-phospholipid O-acyltransferase/long-chain-fatty-acid--[acyl-carrier-protein] ligase|nr:AMP-binding protein [Desulfobulbaceae bacterium]HKJ13443.1 AMP-binding protein [Desulfobulbales bacterium]MDH3543128.1 AMP-binding protein [Desulfobulbaceae bacterium]MDH3776333.1 AMP-binding protein [Desulfobulbaceae bacterium]MDH3782047.1 AMP-binding protein [Desulfobulbaceae bacterium]
MLLHHRFIEVAKRQGEKLAFIDRTAGREVSYSKALIASLLLAGKFKKYDKGFLGVMIPTSAGCGLTILGALMSGRTPVMINYSTGAEDNCRYAQDKCDFETIVTSKALLQKINCPHVDGMVYIEDIMAGLSTLKKIKAAAISKLPAAAIQKLVAGNSNQQDAVILFTSGSEKDPKAVELTHRNIVSNIESFSDRYKFTENDIFLANLPYFHVFGLTGNLWVPLYHGMSIVTYANPLDYRKICDIVRDDKPTLMVGTPSFYWGYLRKSEPGDFASLRYAICGADKCPDALREGFLEKHNMVLYEGYGTTETSPAISANAEGINKSGSVGLPFEGVQIRIEHYETGEECAVGENGKILVKGDLVMKGYFNDFEETSLHIRRGWYDTGDMGNLDEDGYLWHVGRLKRFVKIGGEMVSLIRVENALEKHLPDDVICCVVEVPDAIKGARIVAAVTAPVDEKKILKKIAADLPKIALPKIFTVIEDLPKMGSGKIDFRNVTRMVRQRLNNEED